MKHMLLPNLYRVLNTDVSTAKGVASLIDVHLLVGSALIFTSCITNNKKLFETCA
jgi:hypothetical protein